MTKRGLQSLQLFLSRTFLPLLITAGGSMKAMSKVSSSRVIGMPMLSSAWKKPMASSVSSLASSPGALRGVLSQVKSFSSRV
ncbi:hypothetical protein D3C81_2012160 [compost metagenome]